MRHVRPTVSPAVFGGASQAPGVAQGQNRQNEQRSRPHLLRVVLERGSFGCFGLAWIRDELHLRRVFGIKVLSEFILRPSEFHVGLRRSEFRVDG